MAIEKPIEDGWLSYRNIAMQDQQTALRLAFFAGAYRMMTVLTGQTTDAPEPDADGVLEARLKAVAVEFDAFIKELER